MATPTVFKIRPTTQQYEWGKVGRKSKVAVFAAASIPGFEVDEKAPYAELWMGTHPKSPSELVQSQGTLSDYLGLHPELIGHEIIQRFKDDSSSTTTPGQAGNLPFLFKILSIEKALSIQSHPDKRTAEELFKRQPEIYKDPNHKPEMALALTPFHALCGFRPLNEIARILKNIPELAGLVPATVLQSFLSTAASSSEGSDRSMEKMALRNVFNAIMSTDSGDVRKGLVGLIGRYRGRGAKEDQGESKEIVELVLKLNDQFPGDVGVFCVFLLNQVVLRPGEAIFLGAGEPHAYISGDCIECMANSDNVIRAGLTPKLRDVPNLVSTLTYEFSKPSKHMVQPKPFPSIATRTTKETHFSTLYDPPIPEFSVIKIDIPKGEVEKHPGLGGPSILIVTEGKGIVSWDQSEMGVRIGDVFFVGKGVEIGIKAVGEGEAVVVYRAFCALEE